MDEKFTDKQLVEQVQQGQKQAFNELVLKYQPRLLKMVRRYVGNEAEAMDVTQDVFIKAYRALNKFRGDSEFYTWIYRIAINTAKNYAVSQSRRAVEIGTDFSDENDKVGMLSLYECNSPDRLLQRDELETTIFQAVQALPEELRITILLREMDGMSYEAIADILACPVGTVRSRIFRAREAIDSHIKPLLE